MNAATLKPLFLTTMRNPRAGAKKVLALELPPQVLWIALTLTAILTSLFMAGRLLANPLTADEIQEAMATPQGQQALNIYALFTESPFFVTLMLWGFSVLTVFMLYWAGKAFGGRGSLAEVLCVFTLLQVVTLVASAGIWLVALVLPALAALGSLLLMIWSVWAIVSFLDVAHGYDSLLKAFGVVVMAILGTVFGVSLIMGVIGGLAVGLIGVS